MQFYYRGLETQQFPFSETEISPSRFRREAEELELLGLSTVGILKALDELLQRFDADGDLNQLRAINNKLTERFGEIVEESVRFKRSS
jgi:hypothetical protein